MTIAEKILARASSRKEAFAGDYVMAKIDVAMGHEMLGAMFQELERGGLKDGIPSVWDPEKVVVLFDHRIPAMNLGAAEVHKRIRSFSKKWELRYFYDGKEGICHQVLPEKGHIRPGELIVGTDSHTTTYGAFNAGGTGIGYSEMAYVLSCGELWFNVPETIRFEITGKLADYVMSKDVVLYVAGKHGTDCGEYRSIEWTGPVVDQMSIASRMVISNMSVELGAKFGLFSSDEKVVDYIRARTTKQFTPMESDSDAHYESQIAVDVTDLEPQVACPHSVGNVKPVSELKDIKIDQATIGSCTNGRLEDLEVAAEILKGRKVHPETRLIVAPASWEVYNQALKSGILSILIEAQGIICNSTCGPCTGNLGVLAAGENCISATPRNFKGRMGSREANIYLASPATVAASAVKGCIADPREVI